MCYPASFVLTKDGVFWSKTSNFHLEIVKEHGLNPDGVRGPNIVNVEIIPPNEDYSLPHEKWIFKVDQLEELLPNWCSPLKSFRSSLEERSRIALKEWAKYHCTSQEGQHLIGGFRVCQSFNGDNGTQTADNRSTQTAGWKSTQTAGDESTQTAGDESTQTAGWKSTQTADNESTQTAGWRSTQTAGDKSVQTAGDKSVQTAGINSVQICRWCENGKFRIASRIVTKNEANKPFKVVKGVWSPI